MDSSKLDCSSLAGGLSSPPVFSSPEGVNNASLEEAGFRVLRGGSYRDCSTVMVLPTPSEFIHQKVESAIDGLMKPMNQKIAGPLRIAQGVPLEKVAVTGCEVADAYNQAMQTIQADAEGLAKWRFLLTIEHDNLPPPDGLTKLIQAMYDNCQKDENGRIIVDSRGIPLFTFLGIGGLYWTKGLGTGMPMIYGHPHEHPVNFRPQVPLIDTLQECRGIAMGFTIWNLQALLKDPSLSDKGKWFETKCSWDPQRGSEAGTQDLVFCQKALKSGYRFAVDTSCKVGHFDFTTGFVY